MGKLLKIVGLIFLPVVALAFVFTLLNSGAGKSSKSFFIKEYDEQNIYG